MGINVLVVDDSAVMRAMITKTLHLTGLPIDAVLQAGNGAEAWETIRHSKVDLALVDINMPVMSGEELIDKVRKDWRTSMLPIMVISP